MHNKWQSNEKKESCCQDPKTQEQLALTKSSEIALKKQCFSDRISMLFKS